MTTFARALVTTSLLMVALACANSTTPEPVGGETHFLHSCDGEAACGLGLECVCGVCTKPCTTDNTCKDQSTSATCEPAGTPSGACDNPQASPVCDVKCTSDSECTTLGATYTCESGSCRKLTVNACLYRGVYYSMEAAMSDPCKWCACKATDEACRGTEHCFPDPWKDSGLDASIDGGIDSGMDAGGDAGIDSGFSSGVDSGADAAMDATVDGAIDATFPPPYVCGGGDADAGTATTPLTPRTHACDRLIDVVANPGVEIVARDLDIEGIAAHEGIVYFTSEFGRRGASTDGARYFALPSYPGQPPELARDVVFAGCELYWTDQYGPTPLIVTADDPDGEGRAIDAYEAILRRWCA